MPLKLSNLKDERVFVKSVRNHHEFKRKLADISLTFDNARFSKNVEQVAVCWFSLGKQHLAEAKLAEHSGLERATYSRAYYAVYNASKAVRYLVHGEVSLKGDDHAKASADLPDDFPNVSKWAPGVTTLYEHRLRADYDNWTDSPAENTLKPDEAITLANEFLNDCEQYAKTKYKVSW